MLDVYAKVVLAFGRPAEERAPYFWAAVAILPVGITPRFKDGRVVLALPTREASVLIGGRSKCSHKFSIPLGICSLPG